jgi:hypothetical protein
MTLIYELDSSGSGRIKLMAVVNIVMNPRLSN